MSGDGAAYVGRFAPTPSGRLHLGSASAAIASFLDARAHGGLWIIRLDDLDGPRNEPGADSAILEQLARLQLVSDRPVHRQSETVERYAAALARLRASDSAYPCGCSRRVLVDGVYPGRCRNGLEPGRPARSLRLRVPPGAVAIDDAVCARHEEDVARTRGDFVIERADGIPAYHLATVVDDARAGVTHVVRGADLLDSTPRQVLLQRALSLPSPTYAHLPVLRNAEGQKLSKQNRSPPIDALAPGRVWLHCLRALGQAVDGIDEGGPLDRIVAHAQRRWSRARIPRDR